MGLVTSEVPKFEKLPPPAAAIFLFLALVLGGALIPISWALILTPVLVLGLTAAAAILLRVDIPKTFRLRRPSLADFLMAFPLAISLFVVGDQISGLTQSMSPLDPNVLDAIRELLRAETASEWLFKILVIGVGAAVSEELMFRGFILTALARTGRTELAVVFTSLLFMALHPQFLATLVAGLVLGYVAITTRSIVIPIVVHFVNNVSNLVLFNLADLETLGEPVWIPPSIFIPALAIFLITLFYYRREPEPSMPGDVVGPAEPRPPAQSIRPETLAKLQGAISRELEEIPPGRRRLGWLIVVAAVVLGVTVLLGLFSTSVYYLYPERVHEAGIEVMRIQSQEDLAFDAKDKAPSLTSAFEALSALNASGQLDITDLARVQEAFLRLRADGSLDDGDAEALVETIRQVVQDKAGARPL